MKIVVANENFRLKTAQGFIYRCSICPYLDREANFCGCCIVKILDEMNVKKHEGDTSA